MLCFKEPTVDLDARCEATARQAYLWYQKVYANVFDARRVKLWNDAVSRARKVCYIPGTQLNLRLKDNFDTA